MTSIGLCLACVVLLSTTTFAQRGTVKSSVSLANKRTASVAQGQELTKTIVSPTKCRYILGQHLVGDILVAHQSKNLRWTALSDVTLSLSYSGPTVSYVEITVTQTNSALGKAYVTAGGIESGSITIVVESPQTNKLEFDASYFARG